MPPMAAVRPGCSAMPCAMTLPHSGQGRDRGIGAADAGAADVVTSRSHELASSALAMARRIARVGLDDSHIGAGRARVFRDQLGRHRPACQRGNIDDAQRAGDAHSSVFNPAARAISRSSARMDRPDAIDGTLGDIVAGAANALPRYRLRQHLNHRAISIDGIGIDHAIASLRHGVAGFDPDRRLAESGSGE